MTSFKKGLAEMEKEKPDLKVDFDIRKEGFFRIDHLEYSIGRRINP